MRLKRLVSLALSLLLLGIVSLPVAAATEVPERQSWSERLLGSLAELLGLEAVFASSEVGPGMDPHGEPNGTLPAPEDDPQFGTPPPDEGEKGPGMDPAG